MRDDQGPDARVVVLIAADAAPPSPLMRVLGRKGVAAVLASDEPAVMLELARGPAAAVVLADGDPAERQTTRRELIAAVRRYHPKAAVWHYGRDANGLPTLTVLGAPTPTPTPAPRQPDPPTPPEMPRRSPAPQRNPEPAAARRTAPAPRHDTESDLISEEELRMLLAPDPAPATSRGQRREA